VLVAGQGPIGLMFTRLLALQGMKVVATDLLQTRLNLARQFGAAAVFRPESKALSLKSKVQSPRSKVLSQQPALADTQHATRITQQVSRTTRHAPRVAAPAPRPPFDAAVIAVPSDAVVREAQALVRGGGQVLLFAHTRRGEQTALDLATVCVDEKDLIGSYSSDFRLQEEVARLVFSGKLDARRLITHQFPLAQTAAAIELAAHPTADSLKVVVRQDE
jgi:L-iditol 2-dehydrogenase